MGHHCCNKQKVKRGLWSPEEDEKLIRCITNHGHGCWSSVPKLAGLQRCGKSCRLRWINYLRPDLKRGSFSAQEERIIIDVHRILGNRWAQIAKHLPGRTDNEVKNFWNSCIKKKLIAQGLDPKTHNLIPTHQTTSTINNNACNLNQIYQQPNSIFSIGDAFMNINPSFITLPPPPPPPPPPLHHYHPFSNIDHPQLHESMTINPTFDYQNPNLVWSSVKDNQNSLESTPMSSSSMNPSGIGILDENCLVGGSVDLFQTLRKEEFQQPPQQQHEKWCELEEFINETNEAMKDGQVMESTSFNSSSFDLEFMESTLMPCGMYSNMSSMDQQLEWDY